MRFRPKVPAAYAPAQGATAEDRGVPLVLLFVPQWRDILKEVLEAGCGPQAEIQWAFSREMNMPIWFARWPGDREIAVTFPMQGAAQLLDWWHRHGRVDVILLLEPLAAHGAGEGEPPLGSAAHLRIPQVPFLTVA